MGVGPRGRSGAEGVGRLHHAPAVISSLLDDVDHLPEVLSDLADPQAAGRAEAELPGLTESVGPDLRPKSCFPHIGIV